MAGDRQSDGDYGHEPAIIWMRSARNSGRAGFSRAGSAGRTFVRGFRRIQRPCLGRHVWRRHQTAANRDAPGTAADVNLSSLPGVLPDVEPAQSIVGAHLRVGKEIRAGRHGILADAAGDRDQRGGLLLRSCGLRGLRREQRRDQDAEQRNWTSCPLSFVVRLGFPVPAGIHLSSFCIASSAATTSLHQLPVQESGERSGQDELSNRTVKGRDRERCDSCPLDGLHADPLHPLLTDQPFCT